MVIYFHIKMAKSNNKIIWEDKFDPIIFSAYFFCFIIIFTITLFIPNISSITRTFVTLFVGFILSLSIYLFIKHTFLVLLEDGIILDNEEFIRRGLSGTNIKIASRRIFITWREIHSLYFENHEVRGGRLAEITSFLIVKTSKERYQARINDVLGFVEALKKLNKYNFLTQEALHFIKRYHPSNKRSLGFL